MKTVALVDPFWSGHHSTYLKRISEALLQLGHRVVVLGSEPEALSNKVEFASRELRDNWHTALYRWEPDSVEHSRLGLRNTSIGRIRQLARFIAQTECAIGTPLDLVFFPLLDDFIGRYLTAWDFDRCFARPFSGIYFRPTHLRQRIPHSWLRRGPLNPDDVLRSKHCVAVAVLDEGIAARLSARLGKPVVPFPDITDERCSPEQSDLEKTVREKARGRKIVGLFGSLDRRKGLLTLIQHAVAMRDKPVYFLVAGEFVESSFNPTENRMIKDWMDSPPDNVFLIRRFIEDDVAFNGLVRSCDLLYAVYLDFPYSSNVLTKAALLRVPIVVTDRYLMAERVERYNLGFVLRGDAPGNFRSLVMSNQLFALSATEQFQAGCRDYMEQHGNRRLTSCFTQILGVLARPTSP